jgi:hypothetical protein
MVIGGQAVLLYAEPRLTRDIDITLGLSVNRLPTLLEADFEQVTGGPLRAVLADLERGSV